MRRLAWTLMMLWVFPYGYAGDLDSLNLLIEEAHRSNQTERLVDLYLQRAHQYNNLYQHEEALQDLNTLLAFPEIEQNAHPYFRLLTDLAYTYYWLDDYPEALHHLTKAEKLKIPDLPADLRIQFLSRFADVYINMGDFESALKYQLQALRMSEIHQDTAGIAHAHRVISRIHWYNQEPEKSLVSINQALNFFTYLDDKQAMYTCLAAISSIYTEQKQLKKAAEYVEQSLALAKEINYGYGKAFSVGMLGELAKLDKDWASAVRHLKEAIGLFRQNNIRYEAADFMKSLAEVFALQGGYEKAIDTLNQALLIARAIHAKPLVRDIYQHLSQYYEQAGQYREAYAHTQKYIQVKDSLDNEDIAQRMTRMQAEYDLEKQEREIAWLRQQNQLSSNRLLAISLATGALILLLILLTLIHRFRFHQKQRKALLQENEAFAERNRFLETSHTQLRLMADGMIQKMQEQMEEVSRQAKHLMAFPSQKMPMELKQTLAQLNRQVNNIHLVLQDLIAYTQESADEVLDEIELGELVRDIVWHLPDDYRGKGSQIIIQNLPLIIAHRDKIQRLFEDLIIFAIQHRGDQPAKIKIGFQEKGGELLFTVKDFGAGISDLHRSQLFSEDQENEASAQANLIRCRKIIEQYGGEIWVDSATGEGSTFYFSLPAATQGLEDFSLLTQATKKTLQ